MGLKAIVGATVIDGTGRDPITDAVVLVEGDRIRSISRVADTAVPEQAHVIDGTGHYVIPGLMDANVHLANFVPPELMIQLEGRYSEAIMEASQIALCGGVTTVFDTWGPLEPLTKVRDAINRGEVIGSRIFVAGNIIGLPGPISDEFWPFAESFTLDTVARINGYWEQGVGRDLLWLGAEDVGQKVRDYISRSGVDFIKYAASGHALSLWHYITFSEAAQRAIAEEAHRAGLTVQAHTTSIESLRMEIEAGADVLQHPDVTGPHPIPEDTLEAIVTRQLPCAALVATEKYLSWSAENLPEPKRTMNMVKDINDRRLIEMGARLLLTTDGYVRGPTAQRHPLVASSVMGIVDAPHELGTSHFHWLAAVIERALPPMDALQAATRNVAEAYGKGDELGTLEPGKYADLLVLEADPLTDAANYRRIAHVMRGGELVDRDALPEIRIVTDPQTPGNGRAGEILLDRISHGDGHRQDGPRMHPHDPVGSRTTQGNPGGR